MSEGVREPPETPSRGGMELPLGMSDSALDFHLTVSEPLEKELKDRSPNPSERGGSPGIARRKIHSSLAKAFRKVFRSRTPSPSTSEREDCENDEVKEISSDSDFHDGSQPYLCVPDADSLNSDLPVLSRLNNNSVITTPSEDCSLKSFPPTQSFPPTHTPGVMGKSQTYSALSEALHHAFLEGMICSGAEDVALLSSEDLKGESVVISKSIDFTVNDKKSTSCVLSEVREKLKNVDSPKCLLVPSNSNLSRSHSEVSEVCTDDESSDHSQEDKHERHERLSQQDSEHRNLFGNLFSSRRPSLLPPCEDKDDVSKFKVKEVIGDQQVKGHKKLGDRLSKVAEYLQRGGSKLAEQQRRLKSQIWSSVITIVLVEGKKLLPMDPDGLSDPYVKFRLGNEKYKSKVETHTLNPKWLEQFDFHLFDDQSQNLEITVWDKDIRSKDDLMGRCNLDISQYEREKTHYIWLDLEKKAGSIFILLTISGTTSSETISDLLHYQENPKELKNISDRYKMLRTLHNPRDIGHLRIKVFRAQGLASADIGGKSDPFCVLELTNSRLQTQTEYKTLQPNWNKIFSFNVKDIHSILEITVYDEDRDHKVEFLGKIAIPLLKIKNGEKKWYALKDKKLRNRAKGTNPEILLECSIYWNHIRAAFRTFTPKEDKFMQMEQKFKRQVFIANVNRLKACVVDFIDAGIFIKSCFEWEYPIRSTMAFIGFMVGTYFFEPYMVPIILLFVFLRNYVVLSIVGTLLHREEESEYSADEDDDEEDKDKEEKKTLKERLQAIQEVTAQVQNAIGFIASLIESCRNTFNFSVPFLSWLLILVLMVGTVVLYYVPIRYLVMGWGVNKFTRKLIRPHSVINNELVDFLSRVPDDEILRDCRELKIIKDQHGDHKHRDHRKKKQS